MDKAKYLQEVNQPAKKQNNNKQTTNKFGSDLLPTDSNRVVFADLKINCFFLRCRWFSTPPDSIMYHVSCKSNGIQHPISNTILTIGSVRHREGWLRLVNLGDLVPLVSLHFVEINKSGQRFELS